MNRASYTWTVDGSPHTVKVGADEGGSRVVRYTDGTVAVNLPAAAGEELLRLTGSLVRVDTRETYVAAAVAELDLISVQPYSDAELASLYPRMAPSNCSPDWPAGPYLIILRLLATLRDRRLIEVVGQEGA